jgi:hypothetical protein
LSQRNLITYENIHVCPEDWNCIMLTEEKAVCMGETYQTYKISVKRKKYELFWNLLILLWYNILAVSLLPSFLPLLDCQWNPPDLFSSHRV